jgi:hypothetical protein
MADDGKVTVKLTFKNAGQTPAYNLTPRMGVTGTRMPLKIQLKEAETAPLQSRGVIGAGSTIENEMTLPAFLPQVDMDALAESKIAIFAHGFITYDDIFEKPHVTKFRCMHTGKWGGSSGMIMYDEGNEAD